jgi:hypothetical protein
MLGSMKDARLLNVELHACALPFEELEEYIY